MPDSSTPEKILKPVFGLWAVVGWLILIGLHLLWRYTFGWLFTTLADLMDTVSIPTGLFGRKHLFGPVSDWLRSLDRNVDNALVRAANNLEHTAVWLFSRVGWLIGRAGHELKGLAFAVEHKFARLVKTTIPRLLKRLLSLVWRELRSLGRYARKMIPKLLRQVTRFARWARHEIEKGARHLGFLWKWAKAAIKAIWPVLRALGKRLGRLEKALTHHGFLKLLLPALKALDLVWLTGRNIVLIGKWIITLDYSAVWEFVHDAVTFATTTDLCKLAAYQYDVAIFVFEPVFEQIVGLEDWFCRHAGESMPSAVSLRPGYDKDWTPSATPRLAPVQRLAPDIPLPGGVIRA